MASTFTGTLDSLVDHLSQNPPGDHLSTADREVGPADIAEGRGATGRAAGGGGIALTR